MSLSITTLISVIDSAAAKYIRLGEYKAVYDPYISLTLSNKECKGICDLHSLCNAYSIDTSHDGCFLSRCNIFIDVPSCSTCLFASKDIPLSVVLCPMTSTMSQPLSMTQSTTTSLSATTTDPTTMSETTAITQYTTSKESTRLTQSTSAASSLISKTTNNTTDVIAKTTNYTTDVIAKTTNYTTELNMKDTAVGNTTCVCICRYVNQTLAESIERRKKELVLNKTKLSRAIRKLTSVSDFRKSVEIIGTVAIVVLVLFGFFLLCTDICSIISFVLSTNV